MANRIPQNVEQVKDDALGLATHYLARFGAPPGCKANKEDFSHEMFYRIQLATDWADYLTEQALAGERVTFAFYGLEKPQTGNA